MACLLLAVASVNTHRTRWPTPTPTRTPSYIHLCTQMYNPPPPDAELPFSFHAPASTLPVSPTTWLHGHWTSSLLSVRVREANEFEGERKTKFTIATYQPKDPNPFSLPHRRPRAPTSGLGDNIRSRCWRILRFTHRTNWSLLIKLGFIHYNFFISFKIDQN